MPVTRTYENVCLPLQKLFILSYIVLWYFCFVTLFHFVTYCVTFTLFDCRKNIISASVNLLAILLLCSLAVIVGGVDTSLPISERNSRFNPFTAIAGFFRSDSIKQAPSVISTR